MALWLERLSPLYTDFYELVMAQGYFLSGNWRKRAVFDLSFRSLPFGGGYAIFAGLGEVAPLLVGMRFSEADIDYLGGLGFKGEFLQYLRSFSFSGDVSACREGEVVFADEPVLRVEGNLIEAQLAETLLLNFVSFETLIATKTARIVQAARGKPVIDFGLRRAQGLGGMQATRAAFVGGATGTSNVLAAMRYGIPPVGTQAHSWVQSYDSELEAFREFARTNPGNCVLLVDTYDTLGSGVPNAIVVAREMAGRGQKLAGVRLDSGNLASLAREARARLDQAGLNNVRIVASNRLDEYAIDRFTAEEVPIDVFGVGTRLVTGAPDAALDGVYKLAELEGKPRLKLSEVREKVSNPGRKSIRRYLDSKGTFVADAVCLAAEEEVRSVLEVSGERPIATGGAAYWEELLVPVIKNGKITANLAALGEAASYCAKRLAFLPDSYKRLTDPEQFPVGLSQALYDLKASLVKRRRSDRA